MNASRLFADSIGIMAEPGVRCACFQVPEGPCPTLTLALRAPGLYIS